MKRIYHPYWLWEDYKNGMYELNSDNEEQLINKSISLLTDLELFKEVAEKVVEKWKVSTEVNLTNPNCNHKAWIGQASCCYHYGVPEYITRIAWGKINENQRDNADKVALKVIKQFIKEYESQNYQLHLFMGK